MKITKTDVVYRDKETDVAYTKQHMPMAIAVVTGEAKPVFGVLLTPYGNHASLGWDDPEKERDLDAMREKHGYVADHHCQSIVVSEELFETRFECLGPMSYEIDLAALKREYEYENCSFDDKAALARELIQDAREGLAGAQLYAVLKDLLEPAPVQS